ncbi:hypothetical protein BuS5_01704 [Desulfosarcina sp. BuS5]|uniref:hypothetical protein n=1 Tax=Desulfosarcina sp. BuS5 TaxID=933262 RepID=UPI0006857210|nr:hypothetical protein [Desulfosarcina sp. BuS5]WDN88736.1 hypothetical protein BuS5_01704 [Desulfosarcina sp. BuS5]
MDADCLITYRSPEAGATSKAAIARINPLVGKIRPLNSGKVFSPLKNYSQSADRLDEIIMEVAAMLHPELFRGFDYKFFKKLPQDAETNG